MSTRPRRLPEILAGIAAARGLRVGDSPDARENADRAQLVFVGNWQDPCPRRLLLDAALEPVDIVTWQVVRLHADPSGMVAFPSYVDLMRLVRVSRATIARALAVLRLAGWLPLCASLRDAAGRFAGHIYALNDEPLPMAELLELDATYVRFVDAARAHRSAHVRALALATYATFSAGAESGPEPMCLRDQVAERLDTMVELLARARMPDIERRSAPSRVQNLNSASGSSSHSKKETTTGPKPHCEPNRETAVIPGCDGTALVIPKGLALTDSQSRVLLMRLKSLPTSDAQAVLDEGAGRIALKRATRDPVRCEFDYVARLVVKAAAGEFVQTDAGARIRRDREDRARAEARLERTRHESEARRLQEIAEHEARRRRRDEECWPQCGQHSASS